MARRTRVARITSALALAAGVFGTGTAEAAVDWPVDRILPRFAPITSLDVADMSGLAFDRKAALATLQGIVNRTAPRIYLLDAQQSGEGKNFWIDRIPVTKTSVADPFSLFTKYKAEVKGICIYDPAVPGTINAAVTAAGILDCAVASPAVAQILEAAPYKMPVTLDLRNRGFADSRAAMAWAIAEYWPRCTHRLLAGLRPGTHYPLMDYVVANRALSLWLAPDSSLDRPLLDSVFKGMAPNSAYIGWWAGETSGVGYASGYGVATFASDWFANATVHGGDLRAPASLPEVRPPVPSRGKCQIALILSDGDNLQEQEHLFPGRWKNPLRGTFPVTWTQSPALADFAPSMLGYYYGSRTANDAFISGPSGVGYVLPEKMGKADFQSFAALTETYLKRTGINTLTVWGNATWASDAYGVHCPSVLGIANKQGGGAPVGARYWIGGLASVEMDPDYASFGSQIIDRIKLHLSEWDRKRPLFLAPQLNANVAGLDELKKVIDAFAGDSEVVFVRADQLFQAMRADNPAVISLAPPGAGIAAPGKAWNWARADLLGRRLPIHSQYLWRDR